MVAIQIRDVPERVRDDLAARAAAAGQSLQAFLLEVVTREAAFARNRELIDELDDWVAGGTSTQGSVLRALGDARK